MRAIGQNNRTSVQKKEPRILPVKVRLGTFEDTTASSTDPLGVSETFSSSDSFSDSLSFDLTSDSSGQLSE